MEAAARGSPMGSVTAKLIYSAIASLDGYVADEEGKFDWAAPGEEVHSFINDSSGPSAHTSTGDGCTR